MRGQFFLLGSASENLMMTAIRAGEAPLVPIPCSGGFSRQILLPEDATDLKSQIANKEGILDGKIRFDWRHDRRDIAGNASSLSDLNRIVAAFI